MTENKRFTITQDFEEHHRQIRDNGHIIMGCFVEPQAEVIVNLLNELNDENQKLKEINQDHQDHISLLEEEKINLQIKLQKIRDYAMEDGEVKQGVIEKVICDD